MVVAFGPVNSKAVDFLPTRPGPLHDQGKVGREDFSRGVEALCENAVLTHPSLHFLCSHGSPKPIQDGEEDNGPPVIRCRCAFLG